MPTDVIPGAALNTMTEVGGVESESAAVRSESGKAGRQERVPGRKVYAASVAEPARRA